MLEIHYAQIAETVMSSHGESLAIHQLHLRIPVRDNLMMVGTVATKIRVSTVLPTGARIAVITPLVRACALIWTVVSAMLLSVNTLQSLILQSHRIETEASTS